MENLLTTPAKKEDSCPSETATVIVYRPLPPFALRLCLCVCVYA